MRKRVIIGGDTSTANSGFAVYKRNLLKGLMDSGLFEVAEVGFGGDIKHRELVPWKYYPTNVSPDDPRFKEFASNSFNEYGVWRWDKVCLHFKPTHVVSSADPWQFAHEQTCPLRPYYHWMISPTVDSIPQRVDFLQIIAQADSVYTYTDWAKDYLRSMNIPAIDSIGMGIDPNIMKPLDKAALRRKYKIKEDAIIFGFVARNQMRKRFPDIIESFSIYLKKAPKEIADKSYLLLHTSFVDQGWNLIPLLLDHGVINRVLFTYFCRKTGEIFFSNFKGERCYSPAGQDLSAFSPNVVFSPSDQQLNEVYNLMDYYLQPCTCEGLGYPQIEAAASNIPLIVTDYSAMSELVREFGGTPVKPAALTLEHNIEAKRATQDIELWADVMLDHALRKPTVNSRDVVLKKYTWSHIISKWVEALDRADMPKRSWNAPLKQFNLPTLQGEMSVTQFIHALTHHMPDIKWSVLNLLNIKSLNCQYELRGKTMAAVTPQSIVDKYRGIADHFNWCERVRCGLEPLPNEDFLQ